MQHAVYSLTEPRSDPQRTHARAAVRLRRDDVRVRALLAALEGALFVQLRVRDVVHVARLAAARGERHVAVRVRVVVVAVVRGGVDADVVVRELAHLCVVDAQDLRLLVAAHPAARDVVHDPQDHRLMMQRRLC